MNHDRHISSELSDAAMPHAHVGKFRSQILLVQSSTAWDDIYETYETFLPFLFPFFLVGMASNLEAMASNLIL